MLKTKLSNNSSRPCAGTKLDLFPTRDSCSSSVSLKYSTKRTFRLNSSMSLFNFCVFELLCVGVNFRPFCNNLISVLLNLWADRLIICMSVTCFATGLCMVSCLIQKITSV